MFVINYGIEGLIKPQMSLLIGDTMEMIGLLILGHLVGDYLFQNKRMAEAKGFFTLSGWFWCGLHSAIYSMTICFFLWNFNPWLFVLIFLTHFPIDKFSVASWLFKLKYRERVDFDKPGHLFIYAANDNALHLLLMWAVVVVM